MKEIDEVLKKVKRFISSASAARECVRSLRYFIQKDMK